MKKLTIRIKRQPNNPYALWESPSTDLQYRLLKAEKRIFHLFVCKPVEDDERLLQWWECTQAASDALVRIQECRDVGQLLIDHTVWKSEGVFIEWVKEGL